MCPSCSGRAETGAETVNAVIWTAVVGVAGITGTVVAAFFAPPWTAAKIEARREQLDRQAAARLVAHEVRILATQLNAIARLGFSKAITDTLPTDAWTEHKATLARSLTTAEWREIAKLYGRIWGFKGLADAGGPRDEVVVTLVAGLADTAQLATNVAHMLHHQQVDVPPMRGAPVAIAEEPACSTADDDT